MQALHAVGRTGDGLWGGGEEASNHSSSKGYTPTYSIKVTGCVQGIPASYGEMRAKGRGCGGMHPLFATPQAQIWMESKTEWQL